MAEIIETFGKDGLKLVKSGSALIEYQAFDAKDRSTRLEILMAREAAQAPEYRWLLNITYDHKNWLNFVLTYSFMQVQVEGRNLQNIFIAIRKNNCEWIQEFDSRIFAPPEPDQPFIESIKIIVKE